MRSLHIARSLPSQARIVVACEGLAAHLRHDDKQPSVGDTVDNGDASRSHCRAVRSVAAGRVTPDRVRLMSSTRTGFRQRRGEVVVWVLGATVRGRVCGVLRFVAVAVLVAAGLVAVPLSPSASAQVPHAAVGPPFVIVPSPNPPGAVDGLSSVSCTSISNCFAVGGALIERWNGTSWVIVPSPPSGGLFSVSCTSISNCFAVGSSFDNSSGTYVTLVERWNGTSWVIVPSPNPPGARGSGLSGVSCTSTTSCFAVGSYGDTSGTGVPLVEGWNGIRWAIVPSPNPSPRPDFGGSNLYGVSCTSPTNCLAVGTASHTPPPWYGFTTFVERWNGTAWAIVPSPNPNPGDGVWGFALNSVSCTSTTNCFAVGNANYLDFNDPPPTELRLC
jgi:hypothetical protein